MGPDTESIIKNTLNPFEILAMTFFGEIDDIFIIAY